MHEPDPNHIAQRVLRKLSKYYLIDGIEEVVVNKPGEVWTKLRREDWEVVQAPEIDYAYLKRVCTVLANINGALFSENDIPVVSCELPGSPFRFQAIIGPNVRYDLQDRRGAALAIRALTADTSIDFSSYGLNKGSDLPGAKTGGMTDFGITDDHVKKIVDVIGRHESIIISGATSTGKTTFTNKVIDLIPRDHRVITVEDARELTVHHKNRVHLMVPRNRSANAVGYGTIIDSLMRLTPDWIICGELSIENAQPVYATMGKGHPVITTVHAGSPAEAVSAFANNMSLSSGNSAPLSGQELINSIRSQIGCIIQLERRDGQRRVVEIVFPSRDEAKKNQK
jgi:type IV secretory pathway ATPase VirB11/archaellum biosynthesis ATPase